MSRQAASSEPALPASWTAVLDRILESIGQALQAAQEREASLAGPPSAAVPPAQDEAWEAALGRVAQRIGEVDRICQEAGREGAALTQLLDDGDQAFRLWLRQASGALQRLAKCAGPKV